MIDRLPWMTFQSISFLNNKIKEGHLIFEYGGGGSTLFYLDKGAKVITVEHDSNWFDEISKEVIFYEKKGSWKGFNVPPEEESNFNNENEIRLYSYSSNSEKYFGKKFKKYVRTINRYPDEYFDFIVIDGRARSSCVLESVAKVKLGGFLVLDNTERNYYLTRETLSCLRNFKLILDELGPSPYVDFFTKTNIWKRNS